MSRRRSATRVEFEGEIHAPIGKKERGTSGSFEFKLMSVF